MEEFDDFEEEEEANDAPTVVIDSSLDEKELEKYRQLNDNSCKGDSLVEAKDNASVFSNIQAALKSIQKQEEEEDQLRNKKKVTIMTVEEEEFLEKQINEIRDRIKRGEKLNC